MPISRGFCKSRRGRLMKTQVKYHLIQRHSVMGVTGRCWCRPYRRGVGQPRRSPPPTPSLPMSELVALLQRLHPLLDRHPAASVLGFAYSIREAPVESKRMAGGVGRNATIEDARYRGVPNPEIRCPDRHLAAAEGISLGLNFSVRRMGDSERGGSAIISVPDVADAARDFR